MTKQPGWRAHWIGLPSRSSRDARGALYFRKRFMVRGAPASGKLRIAACGLFEAILNGRKVGQDHLTPGWPDYRRRTYSMTYDIAEMLFAGQENVLGVTLYEGWYSTYLSEPKFHIRYGDDPMLLAELSWTDHRGKPAFVGTDSQWEVGDGPITSASLYHGESYDSRLAVDYHSTARTLQSPKLEISEKICPPVRVREEIQPKAITAAGNSRWICDFGENVAGWVRLQVRAKRGTPITLRFGEMLESDGSLYTANLRSARATDSYICSGKGTEVWEPKTTFHGFRYVEVTGLPESPTPATITAVVVYSDLPEAGTFECSDPLLNQLQRCIVRSQKGNFIDLPTDCPQRDERLGWAGDAQIFCKTALYNQQAAPLFRQWMQAMRDGQRKDGAFPDIAPHIILDHGSAGWSDAGVIVPWTVWRMTGNREILEENFAAMMRHVRWIAKANPSGIRADRMFGDWLAVDAKYPQHAPTPKDLIGTAYYARIVQQLAQIASALDRRDEARRLLILVKEIRRAFAKEYVTTTGRVVGDTQTGYLLALAFDLVPRAVRPAAISHLIRTIEERDWHLSTGFLGTPLLCPVLASVGRADIAWKVVLQKTYPGWLYPVLNGATTMWERWDSWTKERGFGDVGMNSFNHYAYGAIGEFLYATVGGLDQTDDSIGFSRLRIAPKPGGGVTWARTTHQTPHGQAEVEWSAKGKRLDVKVNLPPRTTGVLDFPGMRRPLRVRSGIHELRVRQT